MRVLYPEIAPFNSFTLDVGSSHRLHIEEVGTRGGIPAVFLHGGPGAGCNDGHRRYFDPSRYRVVLFDQRGCNRSTPRGSIEHNTTAHLIGDIERIRAHLKIERWLVFGGSWGAALGLLYAERHPERVSAMILRGAFLARRRDLEWFAGDGANRIFPEAWAEFVQSLPPQDRAHPIIGIDRLMQQPDAALRHRAAQAWSAWADRVTTYLLPQPGSVGAEPGRVVDQVAIEAHYARHGYFIAENQILNDACRVPDVPVRIIHGRRDMTCTLDASWELHRALPHSELCIVDTAGHLASEPPMTDALITATDDFAGMLA